jgi:hypothetical protein
MMLRGLPHVITLTLISLLSPTAIAIAQTEAQTETQNHVLRSGNVTAELSFKVVSAPWTQYQDVRLKVTRDQQVAYDRLLIDDKRTAELQDFWVLTDPKFDQQSNNNFLVQDLDGDREPEILIGFYSGGAHCCLFSAIYRYDAAAKSYTPTVYSWGDAVASFQLRQLDPQRAIPQLISRDSGFAYLFSAYAFSGFPLQIWEYQQGKLLDVTRQYPKLIYDNAYFNWLQIQRMNQDPAQSQYARGPIAAYMADKYMLGQEKDGWARMHQVYQGNDKAKFFADLRQFLIESGYAKQ